MDLNPDAEDIMGFPHDQSYNASSLDAAELEASLTLVMLQVALGSKKG
jgi:hypothetical protein